MALNPNTGEHSRGYASAKSRIFDVGLQAHMQKVYKVMSFGLVMTGIVAFGVATSETMTNLIFNTGFKWVALFAPLAIVWFGFTPQRAARMSTGKLRGMFYLLSAIYGLTFAAIFLIFTADSIARVFFITAGMFGGMSIWGYTTKKDLTGMGSFLMMGLIGLIIASVVNIFMGSSLIHFMVSVMGVLIFTLMTAFDTQRIKESYSQHYGEDSNDKMATLGALSLYLNFILLFQSLMHLFGEHR
jgi:FtsH-binding integral membrane protein